MVPPSPASPQHIKTLKCQPPVGKNAADKASNPTLQRTATQAHLRAQVNSTLLKNTTLVSYSCNQQQHPGAFPKSSTLTFNKETRSTQKLQSVQEQRPPLIISTQFLREQDEKCLHGPTSALAEESNSSSTRHHLLLSTATQRLQQHQPSQGKDPQSSQGKQHKARLLMMYNNISQGSPSNKKGSISQTLALLSPQSSNRQSTDQSKLQRGSQKDSSHPQSSSAAAVKKADYLTKELPKSFARKAMLQKKQQLQEQKGAHLNTEQSPYDNRQQQHIPKHTNVTLHQPQIMYQTTSSPPTLLTGNGLLSARNAAAGCQMYLQSTQQHPASHAFLSPQASQRPPPNNYFMPQSADTTPLSPQQNASHPFTRESIGRTAAVGTTLQARKLSFSNHYAINMMLNSPTVVANSQTIEQKPEHQQQQQYVSVVMDTNAKSRSNSFIRGGGSPSHRLPRQQTSRGREIFDSGRQPQAMTQTAERPIHMVQQFKDYMEEMKQKCKELNSEFDRRHSELFSSQPSLPHPPEQRLSRQEPKVASPSRHLDRGSSPQDLLLLPNEADSSDIQRSIETMRDYVLKSFDQQYPQPQKQTKQSDSSGKERLKDQTKPQDFLRPSSGCCFTREETNSIEERQHFNRSFSNGGVYSPIEQSSRVLLHMLDVTQQSNRKIRDRIREIQDEFSKREASKSSHSGRSSLGRLKLQRQSAADSNHHFLGDERKIQTARNPLTMAPTESASRSKEVAPLLSRNQGFPMQQQLQQHTGSNHRYQSLDSYSKSQGSSQGHSTSSFDAKASLVEKASRHHSKDSESSHTGASADSPKFTPQRDSDQDVCLGGRGPIKPYSSADNWRLDGHPQVATPPQREHPQPSQYSQVSEIIGQQPASNPSRKQVIQEKLNSIKAKLRQSTGGVPAVETGQDALQKPPLRTQSSQERRSQGSKRGEEEGEGFNDDDDERQKTFAMDINESFGTTAAAQKKRIRTLLCQAQTITPSHNQESLTLLPPMSPHRMDEYDSSMYQTQRMSAEGGASSSDPKEILKSLREGVQKAIKELNIQSPQQQKPVSSFLNIHEGHAEESVQDPDSSSRIYERYIAQEKLKLQRIEEEFVQRQQELMRFNSRESIEGIDSHTMQ